MKWRSQNKKPLKAARKSAKSVGLMGVGKIFGKDMFSLKWKSERVTDDENGDDIGDELRDD